MGVASHIRMSSEHRAAGLPIDDESGYTGFSVGLQKAVTAGQIRLASRDPRQQPVLDYRYLTDPWDRERMRSAVRQCVQIAERPEFQNAPVERILPTDENLASNESLDRWLLANVLTQHHLSGTCRMGPASDDMAVVDQY